MTCCFQQRCFDGLEPSIFFVISCVSISASTFSHAANETPAAIRCSAVCRTRRSGAAIARAGRQKPRLGFGKIRSAPERRAIRRVAGHGSDAQCHAKKHQEHRQSPLPLGQQASTRLRVAEPPQFGQRSAGPIVNGARRAHGHPVYIPSPLSLVRVFPPYITGLIRPNMSTPRVLVTQAAEATIDLLRDENASPGSA